MALLRSVLLIVATSLAILIDDKVVLLAQGSGDDKDASMRPRWQVAESRENAHFHVITRRTLRPPQRAAQ